MKKIVYLAGFPRSGSTVLANILAMHPEISATPSSPLCSIIQNMRKQWSDDPFLLAQLDSDGDRVHERLKNSTRAFMQAWSEDTDASIVINKNRGWLFAVECLRELDPDFKIIITLRDLRDIYTSIEKRHRKTLFLDFPDHMEHNMVDGRCHTLFADDGVVGSILKGLENLKDIPNMIIGDPPPNHIYYWRYEDFLDDPKKVTDHVFEFLDVEPTDIDFDNIVQSTTESDSYYRMKYLHNVNSSVERPEDHTETPISPRILNEIVNKFAWYYQEFYPQMGTVDDQSFQYNQNQEESPTTTQVLNDEDEVMIKELEQNIKKETETDQN